tara:strand:+ start:374 stop:994 length:621 start_codon:yes stop_codon:yes gene_type:complete
MVKTWNEAIDNNNNSLTRRKELIHPSGHNDIDYFNSGKRDALHVIKSCELKKDEFILEYGCGDGRILRHLDGHYEVQGVDICYKFIDESRKYNLRTFHIDIDLFFKFDKIYSLTVFIHLNKDQSKKALQYIYKHLKEGGKAYLQILVYGFDRNANEFIGLNYWKKETLIKMVEDIGFKVNHIEEMKGNVDEGIFANNHNNFCIFEK